MNSTEFNRPGMKNKELNMAMSDVSDINNPDVNHYVLRNIMAGIVGYPAVFVAHQMDLFTLLDKASLTLHEVCSALDTDLRATDALLSVNVSLGLIKKEVEQYRLTPTAELYLLKKSPAYMGGMFDLVLGNSQSITIESLRETMKTGATQVYGGDDIFESHAEQKEKARKFTLAMHSSSVAPAMHWPDKLDLSRNKCMLDIGGGSGAHTLGALQRWSDLKGVVYDLPPVCEVALEIALQNNLQNRFSTCPGDLWKGEFPESDIHFYSQIFHDWPDEKCQFLADKSFKYLKSGGRIIVHEVLYNDDKNGPFVAAAASVGMLLWTEGRQYSGQELSSMLAQAGFVDIEVIPTFSYWSIVTAIKP